MTPEVVIAVLGVLVVVLVGLHIYDWVRGAQERRMLFNAALARTNAEFRHLETPKVKPPETWQETAARVSAAMGDEPAVKKNPMPEGFQG